MELICEYYGNCKERCRLTGAEEWDGVRINCPIYTHSANPKWVELTKEMKEACE